MKTKKLLWLTASLAFSMMILVTSCKKNTETLDDNDLSVSADNALAESVFDDISTISDQAYENDLQSFKTGSQTGVIAAPCATVTHDTTSTPRKITIDFGPVNCLCADGRYRRGKIIVTYTGKYKSPGTTIIHTTDQYFVNDHQVLGNKTVINQGLNTNNNLHWAVTVSASIVKPNNGGTIQYAATRDREMIAGAATKQWLDDVYLITGSSSGIGAQGAQFQSVITIPLKKKIGCKHFVSGEMDITRTIVNTITITINFGNGVCDNQAVVTGPNGNTHIITLP